MYYFFKDCLGFENGGSIPEKHSCKGEDVTPTLKWDEPPKETVTFALIMEDPDAPGGTFLHWVIYNIPADTRELKDVATLQKNLENGAIQGENDFNRIGYNGPCPPEGEEHRYFFRLYALKKKLPPESANSIEEFYGALNGFVIERSEYMGKFRK